MSDAIRSNVSDYLQSIGVVFTAAYVGQTTRDNNWQCDEWRVTLSRVGTHAQPALKGARDMVVPFYMGLANRTKETTYTKAKPLAPTAADVLHSLLLDGEAINMSFLDWCADFGSDSDSIKALTTYNACCVIGDELRRKFSSTELQALRDMLQDY